MPDTKITALTAIGANPIIPATFPIPMVDLTDTSMAASGTTKKVTVNQILGAGGTATLASATITGDLTVRTTGLVVNATGTGVQVSPSAPLCVKTRNSDSVGLRVLQSTGGTSGIQFTDDPVTADWGSVLATSANLFVRSNSLLQLQTGGATERFAISSTGICTWSNVGGVAGTAMTLNSTGLGVGVVPSGYRLHVRAAFASTVGGAFIESGEFNQKGFVVNCTSASLSANIVEFQREGVARLTLDASGRLLVGPTSANASGGILQLSSGITFPATQVASSDANTLDDYEEGGWVPTLNSGTFSSASCRFTKIGNMVTIFFDVTVGTGGGDRITNLPFAAASTSTVANGIYTNNQTYAAGTTAPVVVVGGSSSTLFFRTVGTGVAFSAMTLTAAANLTGSISYFV